MATTAGGDEQLITRLDPGDPSRGTNPSITPQQMAIIEDRVPQPPPPIPIGSRNLMNPDAVAFRIEGKAVTWGRLAKLDGMQWTARADPAYLASHVTSLKRQVMRAMGFDNLTTAGGDQALVDMRGGRLDRDPFSSRYVDPDETSGGSGSGRRGGGGGGALAPVFIPSDLATITDQVRSYVVAVTGTANEAVIKEGIAAFQSAEKEAFNKRETQTIDAWSAMKTSVRGTSAYKTVNDNRPDSVDEMEWVTGMQAKMRQLGLSAERAEQLGISAATTAAAGEGLRGLGEVAQVGGTGRMLESHRERMKRTASIAAGLL